MNETSIRLTNLRKTTSTPRDIALTRQRLLSEEGGRGLPVMLHDLLRESLCEFEKTYRIVAGCTDNSYSLAGHASTDNLTKCLQIHLNCVKLDSTLGVELGAQGTHAELRRIVQWESHDLQSEVDVDTIMDLQDLACEIAALYSNFPMKASPFPPEALLERLPLSFCIQPVVEKQDTAKASINNELVLIHQVTARQSAQEDVGFVMWPSAVVLSRWLLSNPQVLSQASQVMEIGAGCGLVGLLAARLLQKQWEQSSNTKTVIKGKKSTPKPRVILTDFNRKVLDNLQSNISLNEVEDICETTGLDFYQQSGTSQSGWLDMEGQQRAAVPIILAADMICQPADATCAARTIHDALVSGGKAYVVCADAAHRFGVDHFARECAAVGLDVTAQSVADLCPALVQGPDMEKTTGYVEGMNLTMFFIEKPKQ